MSENNNNENNQIKSSELAETDKFNKAIASRDAIIGKKDAIIEKLQSELGKREESISSLIEKIDAEKSLRIEAEQKVTQDKPMERPGQRHVLKSKEEQFADAYRVACEKIRQK